MQLKNIHNLDYKENGAAEQYLKCPWCSDERKKKNTKTLSVNIEKRVFHCHHCAKSGSLDGYEARKDKVYVKPQKTGWSNFDETVQTALAARGFSLATIQANKIIQKKWTDKETGEVKVFIGYPYFELEDKDPVNVKWRCATEKRFMQEKDAKPVMYNLKMWANEPDLIICEGENDVMAFNEAGFWNATTTNGGAINENDKNVDGKLESFYNCHQYIENKKVVYIATDNDGPGRRLKEELIKRIGANRCKIVTFPEGCKDANDVLLKLGKEELVECISSAKEIPISGVFQLKDQMAEMLDIYHNGEDVAETTHFGELDQFFRWKKGQVNLWTGYANMGKTTLFLQMALTKSIMDGWKWAIFSPENYPATDFYQDIIEMYIGKNVSNRFGNKMSEAEFIAACNFINDHMFFIYPDEKHTVEELHQAFQSLLMKEGIDGVLIDPYNQLEKSFPGMRTDEEISEFMRVVKRFTVQSNISYNIIVHPRSPQREKGSKELKVPDAYDIAGGAMWANKADNILVYHRPNWHTNKEDPTVEVHTQKIKRKRTGGKLGFVVIHYNVRTSRYYDGNLVYCDPARKYRPHHFSPAIMQNQFIDFDEEIVNDVPFQN